MEEHEIIYEFFITLAKHDGEGGKEKSKSKCCTPFNITNT